MDIIYEPHNKEHYLKMYKGIKKGVLEWCRNDVESKINAYNTLIGLGISTSESVDTILNNRHNELDALNELLHN